MSLRSLAALRATMVALTVAGLAACGGSDGPTGASSSTKLELTNSSSLSVWYIRTRACGAQTWGPDLLGANVLIPGESGSFAVSPGCQDVKLNTDPDYHGEVIWASVQFPTGQTTPRTISAWSFTQ